MSKASDLHTWIDIFVINLWYYDIFTKGISAVKLCTLLSNNKKNIRENTENAEKFFLQR